MVTTRRQDASTRQKTMGLFGRLFGKSEPAGETPDAEVYMHREYLNRHMIERLNRSNVVLITFFQSTQRQLTEQCADEELKSRIILYPALVTMTEGLQIAFAERHPLQQKETEALQRFRQSGLETPVTAYCALDDTIMLKFGGGRITGLMKNMGMKETECIRHPMISSSIKNAQKKTLKKVTYEQQAKSPEEWYQLNLQGT